ncbi:MAG: hypothetical protein CUN55_18945, partial [Phototrophicales bacterium]
DEGNSIEIADAFRDVASEAVEVVLVGPSQDNTILQIDPSDPTRLIGYLWNNRDSLAIEGEYQIYARLTDRGASGYNRENYNFGNRFNTPSITLEAIELEGVLLDITSWQQRAMYNVIVNQQKQHVPLPVEVRLINQNGAELNPAQVFV